VPVYIKGYTQSRIRSPETTQYGARSATFNNDADNDDAPKNTDQKTITRAPEASFPEWIAQLHLSTTSAFSANTFDLHRHPDLLPVVAMLTYKHNHLPGYFLGRTKRPTFSPDITRKKTYL